MRDGEPDRRTPGEVAFANWLDTVATDTSQWRFRDPVTSDAPMRRYVRQEQYRLRWLKAQDWYQHNQRHYQQLMKSEENQLTLSISEVVENATNPGFWEQF